MGTVRTQRNTSITHISDLTHIMWVTSFASGGGVASYVWNALLSIEMVNKRVMGHLHFPDTCSETAYPKTPTFISNLNCKWRSPLGTIGVDTFDPFDSMTWLCSCKNIHSKVDRQTCFMDACVCCAHVCLCVLCVHVHAAIEAARLIKSITHRQGCCRHLHVQWKPVNTRAYYILMGGWSVRDTITILLVADLGVSTLLCGTGAYTTSVQSSILQCMIMNLLPHLHRCLNMQWAFNSLAAPPRRHSCMASSGNSSCNYINMCMYINMQMCHKSDVPQRATTCNHIKHQTILNRNTSNPIPNDMLKPNPHLKLPTTLLTGLSGEVMILWQLQNTSWLKWGGGEEGVVVLGLE